MKKHEEQIGVRLPDGRRFMATALVGPLESDEEILSRMTKEVGTVFHVNGQKLLVTSLKPFVLKNISEEEAETPTETLVPKGLVKAKVREPVVAEPKSEPRSSTQPLPQVGERWRPKDPRRIASFVVREIVGDEVLTDDGRSIALGRFCRYVRVDAGSQANTGQ